MIIERDGNSHLRYYPHLQYCHASVEFCDVVMEAIGDVELKDGAGLAATMKYLTAVYKKYGLPTLNATLNMIRQDILREEK